MQIAGLQLEIAWESPQVNHEHARTLAERSAAAGAEMVVLPEMFATGFTMNSELAARHAEATRACMRSMARDLELWVLAGLVEEENGQRFNRAVLWDPSGEVRLRHSKLHPFTLVGEERSYAAGDALVSSEVHGVRITALVCYDLRFPELFRITAESTDLFVVIANWPRSRRDPWLALLRARAIDSQAYVLGVNRIGKDANGVEHCGDSVLLDPLGRTITTLCNQEGFIPGAVDSELVRSVRQRYPFLTDRRPNLYRQLTDTRRHT